MIKKVFKIEVLISIVLIEFFAMLFINYPANDIISVQSDLISVSGIFCGILIALFSAKLFQEKSHKEQQKKRIDNLSFKLTQLRRIIYFIKESDGFWTNIEPINEYRGIRSKIQKLKEHDKDIRDEITKIKDLKSKNGSIKIFELMNSVYGSQFDNEFWLYDRRHKFDYTIEEIERLFEPISNLWYYFDGRYAKHTEGYIDDSKVDDRHIQDILEYSASIDKKFQRGQIDRHLIADLGTEFHLNYLPELIDLKIDYDNVFNKSLKKLFYNIVIIATSGIIVPLILKLVSFSIEYYLTIFLVLILLFGFIKLIVDLRKMINIELKV
jgi:hypothetical protein